MPAKERLALSTRAVVGMVIAALKTSFPNDWARLLGMHFDSVQKTETYNWLGASPALREWVGGRQLKGLRKEALSITNKLWEATLAVAIEDMWRDKLGQIQIRIDDLARRGLLHWRSLINTLIVNGTGDTYGACYDSQYFFDDDHESGSSGSQTNLLTNSEVASLNVGTADAPTQAEMALAILDVIGYMLQYKDDQGEPAQEDAREFHVMVPYNLHGAAQAAASLDSIRDASGTVISNPLKGGSDFKVTVGMNARLTTTTVFYTFITDQPTKAFILQEEKGLEVDSLTEGSDHAFKENEYLFGVKTSRNAGYGEWLRAAHCTLS